MSISRYHTWIALFLVLLLVLVRIIDPLPVQIVRTAVFDLYQRTLPREQARLPVTIIDIDEASLDQLGQWPWPRSLLTELMEKLAQAKPLAIGFDMLFSEPDRLSPSNMLEYIPEQLRGELPDNLDLADNDLDFARSFEPQRVVLGAMLNTAESSTEDDSVAKAAFVWNRDPINFTPSVESRLANVPVLEKHADGIGVLNLLPEPDGVVRRVPSVFRVADQLWPSFGLEVVRLALSAEKLDIEVDDAGINSITAEGISIPTDSKGLSWLHFNRHDQSRSMSAIDVLEEKIDMQEFSGHILLIGTSASGLNDLNMTPLGEQMPGVEIWAQWIETSLFGQLLERPNYTFVTEVLFLLFFCLVLIFMTTRASARTSLAVFSALTLVCVGFSWWMYSKNFQLFDFSFPLICAGILFASLMFMKFWREEHQRRQIRNAFKHYLSPSVVDELTSDPTSLRLGGELKEITSLFTDLEGFTRLSQSHRPEELVDFINQYLDGICRIIISHGGTIDKIIGDAVHAIFGAPKNLANHASLAVDCALDVDRFCNEFRQSQLENDFELGVTRIGINSGSAVVGNFGGEDRFDYTAYGDTINTASRLESANQFLGTRICVAEATVNRCDNHLFRPIADLTVRGKPEPIAVFEPIMENSNERDSLKQYLEAYSMLKKHDSAARDLFKVLQNKFPQDMVLGVHLKNIEKGITGTNRGISEV